MKLRAIKLLFNNNCFKSVFCNSQTQVFNFNNARFLCSIKIKPEEKVGKKAATDTLQEIFGIRPFAALEIVTQTKGFTKTSNSTIHENYKICAGHYVKKEIILKYPEILIENRLEEKIVALRDLPYDINELLPLLCIKLHILEKFIQEELHVKKIECIANSLEIKIDEVCKLLVRRPFLRSLQKEFILNNIELLTGYGISKKDILKDLWVLKYSENMIKNRLELAKMNKIETKKTWMVRCKPEIFERYVTRRSENKCILGNNSVAEYLSERLQCTIELAKHLITKHPALETKSLTKMNEIIDFLYAQGFKPVHICRVPKVLLHSVDTTKKRLQELETHRVKPDSLYVLTKSQKQYMQYYEALVNKNKSKTVG